jgi:alkylation response protein AidB-like acyl-CoA dehydrogenase
MSTPAHSDRRAELAAAIRAIGEGAAERDFNDENPFAAVEIARKARIGALRLPVELGGYGFSIREFFATLIDLAEADAAVAHIFRTHFWFAEERLHSVNTTARARWLGEIGRGAIIGNASSEQGSSAVGSLRFSTTLTPVDGGFQLSGTKYYSTGSLFADWTSVWAMRDENTLAAVVVQTGRPGVTLHDDWDGIGLRKTGTGTSVFDKVFVSEDEVVALYPLDRPATPTYEFAFLQLYLQALLAGILRNVVSDAVALLHGRERSFAHAPAARPVDDPILQTVVGQLSATAFAAEATVLAAADALDAAFASVQDGSPSEAAAQNAIFRAAQAKVHVDEIALEAASRLFEVGGASAASRKRNLDRHWRAIRTLTLHNPTAYKAQAIGQHLINGVPFPVNGYF